MSDRNPDGEILIWEARSAHPAMAAGLCRQAFDMIAHEIVGPVIIRIVRPAPPPASVEQDPW